MIRRREQVAKFAKLCILTPAGSLHRIASLGLKRRHRPRILFDVATPATTRVIDSCHPPHFADVPGSPRPALANTPVPDRACCLKGSSVSWAFFMRRSDRPAAYRWQAMKLLTEICSIPTAPFAEQYVIQYVEKFVAVRKKLQLTRDRSAMRAAPNAATSPAAAMTAELFARIWCPRWPGCGVSGCWWCDGCMASPRASTTPTVAKTDRITAVAVRLHQT